MIQARNKKERSKESAQEANTKFEKHVKKKMKEKKEREVDDNMSLKKNLSTRVKETAVVRGIAKA
jgi:hypothetical protein